MSWLSTVVRDAWQKAELESSVIDRYTLLDRSFSSSSLADKIKKEQKFSDTKKLIVRKLCLRANVLDDDCFMLIFKTIKKQMMSGQTASDPAGSGGLDYIGYVFPLNPSRFDKSQKKLVTWVLGAGGYTAQIWGNSVVPITCTGTTGRIFVEDELNEGQRIILNSLPDDFEKRSYLAALGKGSLKDTITWKAFKQLQFYYQYYNGGNEINTVDSITSSRLADVYLLTVDKLYKGLLTEFNWSEECNDPWQVKYNFKFEAFPVLEDPNVFTDVLI